MFLKVPVKIIVRFGENNVLGLKYIVIYQFWGFAEGVTCPPHIIFFIIHKNGKCTRAWPILKSNSTSFWFKFFLPRMNNKNILRTGGRKGVGLLFLYQVSMVVLIDFMAILITPGIFVIQIVNTNMYFNLC